MLAQSCFTKKTHWTQKKRTSYTAYLRLFVWNRNYREIFVKLYRLISLNSKTKYDYNYVRIDVLNTFLTICFFLLWELVYILERKATVHFQRREKMIGHQTHLKENEDLPLLDSPLIEARRAKKKFLETAPLLISGSGWPPPPHPPSPPSEGLDPQLTSRYVFVVIVVLFCLFVCLLFFYALITLEIDSIDLNEKCQIQTSPHVSESGFWNACLWIDRPAPIVIFNFWTTSGFWSNFLSF